MPNLLLCSRRGLTSMMGLVGTASSRPPPAAVAVEVGTGRMAAGVMVTRGDEVGPILSFDQVVQEAEKRGVSLPSLPADMVEAAKCVGIQILLLLRYLDMQVFLKELS